MRRAATRTADTDAALTAYGLTVPCRAGETTPTTPCGSGRAAGHRPAGTNVNDVSVVLVRG